MERDSRRIDLGPIYSFVVSNIENISVDLRQLRHFLTTAEESKASHRLGVSMVVICILSKIRAYKLYR